MNQYGKCEYWEERYNRDSDYFEWYQTYSTLKPFLLEVLQNLEDPAILHVGCGTSKLAEELFHVGYKNIISIDYSSNCIEAMNAKNSGKNSLIFKKMDIREMSFDIHTFHLIIDKGTLDSIFCFEKAEEHVPLALKQISRVLMPGGVYFYVSYGTPEHRLPYLEESDLMWDVEFRKIDKPRTEFGIMNETNKIPDAELNYHYIYMCRKKTQL